MPTDETRIYRIETKIDKLDDRLGSIDVTLARQHESLKEHMRRTAILEKEFTPVKNHVQMVGALLKGLGILALILETLHYFW